MGWGWVAFYGGCLDGFGNLEGDRGIHFVYGCFVVGFWVDTVLLEESLEDDEAGA